MDRIIEVAEKKLQAALATPSKLVAFTLLNTACEELTIDVPELQSWEIHSIHEQVRFMLAIIRKTAGSC